jgi:hypothetical protein
MHRRTIFGALAAILGVAGTPSAWSGSVALAEIPPAVAQNSGPMGAGEMQQIAEHVKQHAADLKNPEATKRRTARDRLLEPLGLTGVTVSFRQAYSRELTGQLKPLVEDSNDAIAINALRLAGELATEGAMDLVLPLLSGQQASVRFAAAHAVGSTLRLSAVNAPAIRADSAVRLLKALEDRFAVETDTAVMDRLVLSMGEGARGDQNLPGVRAEALRSLGRAVSASVGKIGAQKVDEDMMAVFVRAGEIVRDGLTVGQGQTAMPADVLKISGGMSGQLLALVSRQIRGGALPSIVRGDEQGARDTKAKARVVPGKLVAAAESVIYFARIAAGESQAPQTRMNEAVRSATNEADARFASDSQALIESALTKPPFGFRVDEFKLR